MERENYVDSLKQMTANEQSKESSSSETIRHGNLRTTSTQTNNGIWLDSKKTKRKRQSSGDDIKDKDVEHIRGTVMVDGSNLISDGCGGYYMRVDVNAIRPVRNNSNTYSSHRNHVPHSSDVGPRGSSYYANQDIPNHSMRPSHRQYSNVPFFYSNQPRYSSDRADRRYADHSTRPFSQTFRQEKYSNDSNDLFK